MKHPLNRETLDLVRHIGFDKPYRWIHSYIYFSYTRQYLKTGVTLARRLPRVPDFLKAFALRSYRGKAATLEDAKKLVHVNLNIPVEHAEQVIPLGEAKDIVYRTGEKILVAQCYCRMLKKDHCEPTEVCLFVGREVARFIGRQKPKQTRWITQAEAIAILEETERLGWTHLVFSRDIVNDEFFVICNCCKCCCAGMMMQKELGLPLLHPSGYRATVGAECSGCGICEGLCQMEAIGVGAEGTAVIDYEKCLACGACASNCPEEAITLEEAAEGLRPLRLWD